MLVLEQFVEPFHHHVFGASEVGVRTSLSSTLLAMSLLANPGPHAVFEHHDVLTQYVTRRRSLEDPRATQLATRATATTEDATAPASPRPRRTLAAANGALELNEQEASDPALDLLPLASNADRPRRRF
jgi:hypothetical protein